jgi:hypothetical protein
VLIVTIKHSFFSAPDDPRLVAVKRKKEDFQLSIEVVTRDKG